MRLLICAVGRLKAGPERELEARYLERARALGRGLQLTPIEVAEIAESQARRPQDRMAEEATRLAALLPSDATVIALDETGQAPTSADFVAQIVKRREAGRSALAFVIGGADGLDPSLRTRAEATIGFGRMTLPHQLVRVVLAEQIYRATTLLAGHPYHRA